MHGEMQGKYYRYCSRSIRYSTDLNSENNKFDMETFDLVSEYCKPFKVLRRSRKLSDYAKEIKGISMQINLQRLTVPTFLTSGSSLHHRRDPKHRYYCIFVYHSCVAIITTVE